MCDIPPKARLIMLLYFREGWSYRRIGRTFGIHHYQVRRVIDRTCATIAASNTPETMCATHPLVRALVTHPDADELRGYELVDRVEDATESRASYTRAVEDVMAGESTYTTHVLRNHWDQWELHELARRGATTLPPTAYEAKVLWRYAE